MELRLSTEADVVVVALEGRLTGAADAARLVEAIERLVVQGRQAFLFDLEQVGWVDSTGIGALVSIFETVRRQGGTTRFAGLNDRLLRIMEITKLDRVLDIHSTRSEALEAFGRGEPQAESNAPSDSGESAIEAEESDEVSDPVDERQSEVEGERE